MNNLDLETLGSCLASRFAFTGADQTIVTTREEMKSYYDKMFKSSDAPLASLHVEPKADILTQFLGPDIGYCYWTSQDTYTLTEMRPRLLLEGCT
ncbi:hypothetical protein HYR69_07255 [Candidatus Sumerlaeota bacterium]|nr:hypothetical protein [Candidatus Sumerlaeota bacterium]